MSEAFTPDESEYDLVDGELRGHTRLRGLLERAGIDLSNEIVTSRDPRIVGLINELEKQRVPRGLRQWWIPIPMTSVLITQTVAESEAIVPAHTHHKSNGLHIVASGTVFYVRPDEDEVLELAAGDWLWVPAGHEYELRVGRFGAVLLYPHEPNGNNGGTVTDDT